MKYTGWCQNGFNVEGYSGPAPLGLLHGRVALQRLPQRKPSFVVMNTPSGRSPAASVSASAVRFERGSPPSTSSSPSITWRVGDGVTFDHGYKGDAVEHSTMATTRTPDSTVGGIGRALPLQSPRQAVAAPTARAA